MGVEFDECSLDSESRHDTVTDGGVWRRRRARVTVPHSVYLSSYCRVVSARNSSSSTIRWQLERLCLSQKGNNESSAK